MSINMLVLIGIIAVFLICMYAVSTYNRRTEMQTMIEILKSLPEEERYRLAKKYENA